MDEAKMYEGGCHCGAVRFEVPLQLGGVVSCNCSICSRTAMLLSFAPAAQFKLLSGEDALRDYQFGKKHIHHLFCGHCGVRAFGRGRAPDGAEMVAVNVRCLDNVDATALPVKHHDGKSVPIQAD